MSLNRARSQAIAQSWQKTTIPEMQVAIQNAFGHRSGTLRILSSGRFRVTQNVLAFESPPRRKPRSGGALAPFAPPAVRTKADRAFAGLRCRRAAVAPPAGSVLGCLGPWHRDRIAISNKTPARCRMGSGEEERLCGVAGYRDPARAPENPRKPMNQARHATSGIAGRQWQQGSRSRA